MKLQKEKGSKYKTYYLFSGPNWGKIWDKIFEQSVERAAAAPLAYGYFALETQGEAHINGAKVQLGVE